MLEIGVAGCGPAGLAAALFLSRAGHRVRIFERFEAPRPVGSGIILQPVGMAALAELGLNATIQTLGARVDRLFGVSEPSGRVALDVRYDAMGAGWHGLGVHRAALFETLYAAALAQGIEIVCGVSIAGLDRTGARPLLVDAQARAHGPFDLVVDALGARSPLVAFLHLASDSILVTPGAW